MPSSENFKTEKANADLCNLIIKHHQEYSVYKHINFSNFRLDSVLAVQSLEPKSLMYREIKFGKLLGIFRRRFHENLISSEINNPLS